MDSTEDMRDVARAIRPYLATLLGDQAQVIEKELEDLLGQTTNEAFIEAQIMEVLHRHTTTQEWLERYFNAKQSAEQDQTKSNRPNSTVGPFLPPPPRKYHCPDPSHQDYVVFQRSIGQKMRCPIHHVALVPATNTSGGNHDHQNDGGIGR